MTAPIKTLGLAVAALFLSAQASTAQLTPRNGALPPQSPFVTVDLQSLANDSNRLEPQLTSASINAIPFEFPGAGANGNLFLHQAGWPDWQADSPKFFPIYDDTPAEPTPELPVVQIPVDDYTAAYALVSCENSEDYSNLLTLRIGVKRGKIQTTYYDYEFEVPRLAAKGGPNVLKSIKLPQGNAFLLRLPLNGAWSQRFRNVRCLDVEMTKQLRLAISKPDPARFQYRPLGLPSGVHLYGLTFERSPIRLELEATQPGQVFNQPEVPTFHLKLNQVTGGFLKAPSIRATLTDNYGRTTPLPPITDLNLPASRIKLACPVSRRGYYVLNLGIYEGERPVLQRQTTFVLLPRNTRKYRQTSPFGTWDSNGAHYTPTDVNLTGPLYVKAGLRYGMFRNTMAERRAYGMLPGNDPKVRSGSLPNLDKYIADIKANRETPTRWMLFHEDAISGDHATRTPSIFTGREYKLSEAEEKKFQAMKSAVEQSVPRIRAAFPGVKFMLGNGNPLVMEEFLRRKLSPDLFDSLGNESAAFQRPPESQPLDWIANNPSLWMERQMLDHYGYRDKTVEQCYETDYPSSTPGNLTLNQQADYMVRNIMHSLAWRVPTIRFGGLVDPGNSYLGSNWGGAGLMFGQPDLSPKPLYAAIATMTQQLDGATFTRMVPTGAETLYAFEFSRRDGGFVTCFWTSGGTRQVQLKSAQKLSLVDLMSNEFPLQNRAGSSTFASTPAPVFISSARPLLVSSSRAVATDPAASTVLTALANLDGWNVDAAPNPELESYNFLQPRQRGEFHFRPVSEFEGRQHLLEVKPVFSRESPDRWYFPRYVRLSPKKPLPLPGTPTHIGLSLNGNGGWGRVIFELEDAAGQRWVSLGAEQKGTPSPWLADWLGADEFARLQANGKAGSGINSWNGNDAWGRSLINWAGWGEVKFPLPGNYSGEGYHWPYTSQWRCVKPDGTPGDYTVHYPLQLTGLGLTARSKILYGTEVRPIRRPEIYLQNLTVSGGDPDTDFWHPAPGQR